MPLSEDEQRILRQIEQELEQDPTFSNRGYRVSRRRLVLLIVGLVAGLAVTISGLAFSFWLAFAGFVAVFVMAVLLEAEIRVLGRERLGALPISAWLGGARRPSRRADDGVVGLDPCPQQRPRWRRRLVAGFIIAVLTVQLGFAINGYRDPHKFFAFQPFNESSTWQADIVRVTWDGERGADRRRMGRIQLGRARRHGSPAGALSLIHI